MEVVRGKWFLCMHLLTAERRGCDIRQAVKEASMPNVVLPQKDHSNNHSL